MKVVILAGGSGTRITEESSVRPKPMIEIGHRPILWHIMKIYTAHGLTDFIICCGYKGRVIKEYFANYFLSHADYIRHNPSIRQRFRIVNRKAPSSTGLRAYLGFSPASLSSFAGAPFALFVGHHLCAQHSFLL